MAGRGEAWQAGEETSVVKHRLSVSRAQVEYLHELITDDLEETDLSTEERQQAESVLRQLDTLLYAQWGVRLDERQVNPT